MCIRDSSDEFFWAKGATGRIAAPPDAVTALSGPWDDGLTRRENSSLGTNTVYWVWLDEPQLEDVYKRQAQCNREPDSASCYARSRVVGTEQNFRWRPHGTVRMSSPGSLC